MSKEKQIEEMAEVLRHSCENECFRDEDGFVDCEVCKACILYDAGYRKQEWISVEERLPENYRPVLVACEGLTIGGYAPIAIGSYGGGLWSLADADGTAYLTKYMRCTVTHWMPLPEPPKGE
jgi:hypothetical protein